MFNGLTIEKLLSVPVPRETVILSVLASLFCLFIYQLLERHLREDEVSGAVFYHEFFVATQSFYTALAVLSLLFSTVANLSLLFYLATLAYGFYTHVIR